MPLAVYRRQVWSASLDPVSGHEQGGTRPVLVISNDTFNNGPAGLVVILPCTTTDRGIPVHVKLEPGEGGLARATYVVCDQVRTISKERLKKLSGWVGRQTMESVEDSTRIICDL
jgi:mRNA interferase MazF